VTIIFVDNHHEKKLKKNLPKELKSFFTCNHNLCRCNNPKKNKKKLEELLIIDIFLINGHYPRKPIKYNKIGFLSNNQNFIFYKGPQFV
jgi:hypothetical protein